MWITYQVSLWQKVYVCVFCRSLCCCIVGVCEQFCAATLRAAIVIEESLAVNSVPSRFGYWDCLIQAFVFFHGVTSRILYLCAIEHSIFSITMSFIVKRYIADFVIICVKFGSI